MRLGVEGRGEEYHSFPQREVFDKIGIRDMVMETDPYGNFLIQGYEFGTGRDWARLGNLYLQDGVWRGERILPEGFVEFVSTPAPAFQRLFLDQQYGRLPDSERRVLHGGRRKPENLHHSLP